LAKKEEEKQLFVQGIQGERGNERANAGPRQLTFRWSYRTMFAAAA